MRNTKQFYGYFLLAAAVIVIASLGKLTDKAHAPQSGATQSNAAQSNTAQSNTTGSTSTQQVTHQAANTAATENIPVSQLVDIVKTVDEHVIDELINDLDEHWHDAYIAPLLEVYDFASSDYAAEKVLQLLQTHTKQTFGNNMVKWSQWLWNQPASYSPDYANFKAILYRHVDPAFEGYFLDRANETTIRLDEIRWGGVPQDGIPPLHTPAMIPATEAGYLEDSNIVFGITINGDSRAYPKRILAWHELFTDNIGGINIAGVYCTLCGTVIPYLSQHKDSNHQLGTSGFLYRSNKLMYDQKTQSLWNTLQGEPVLGPLAGRGIRLEFASVVTTTWEEWRKRHPETTVLSAETGYRRHYGEGIAYQRYFATDDLLFSTPFNDTRLKNKQEVLALRFAASPDEQLAIDTDFLTRNPLYTDRIGQQQILVITDRSGANRVYDPRDIEFINYDGDRTLIDNQQQTWQVHEEYLLADKGQKLLRLPYHRAFWFGWHAAFPQTRLVK
jgi:hypothetical protein